MTSLETEFTFYYIYWRHECIAYDFGWGNYHISILRRLPEVVHQEWRWLIWQLWNVSGRKNCFMWWATDVYLAQDICEPGW